MIKFEICKGYEEIATIPTRATQYSAGYDFYNTNKEIHIMPHSFYMIFSGICAEMEEDMVLLIYIRSSVAVKKGIVLTNNVAVIDKDYYPNNIGISLTNTTDKVVTIEPYERIAQGIFMKYHTTDDDCVTTQRVGGIGSTNKK